MRVLAHIHTMNDAAVIEQALDGLRRQTRPPDAILIVDNASTDTTLDKTFPKGVAIVRNATNLGTSGAIQIGFAHALEQGFDWTWVFDADSVPEPDALENLLHGQRPGEPQAARLVREDPNDSSPPPYLFVGPFQHVFRLHVLVVGLGQLD